jgi:hypothetical protein
VVPRLANTDLADETGAVGVSHEQPVPENTNKITYGKFSQRSASSAVRLRLMCDTMASLDARHFLTERGTEGPPTYLYAGGVPYSPDLDRLLTEGARSRDERADYVIGRHTAGEVNLPTGRVVGCDPLMNAHAASSFTVTAPAGTYPLYVWVAVLYRDSVELQRRVAALQLVVSDRPPFQYQMAMTAGQDLAELDEDSYFGFPVGAGAATLADLTAVRALAEWDFERLDATYIPAQIPAAPVPVPVPVPVPGDIYTAVTDEATGANVTVVSSGWGDGLYPTFIGYAPCGAVSSFTTDFMVVPHDAETV